MNTGCRRLTLKIDFKPASEIQSRKRTGNIRRASGMDTAGVWRLQKKQAMMIKYLTCF
jgi:hypothetical protein